MGAELTFKIGTPIESGRFILPHSEKLGLKQIVGEQNPITPASIYVAQNVSGADLIALKDLFTETRDLTNDQTRTNIPNGTLCHVGDGHNNYKVFVRGDDLIKMDGVRVANRQTSRAGINHELVITLQAQ